MIKILVIDDSEVIRRLLQDYLTDLGYQVTVAVDGQEGIERALADDFPIVICDIHMPRKNGYQVYREVSREKPGVSFVMTDSLPDELAEMAEKAGACCCLRKPFDLTEVRQTIGELCAVIEAR